MNIWLRKKVPFYARHIRKKLFLEEISRLSTDGPYVVYGAVS